MKIKIMSMLLASVIFSMLGSFAAADVCSGYASVTDVGGNKVELTLNFVRNQRPSPYVTSFGYTAFSWALVKPGKVLASSGPLPMEFPVVKELNYNTGLFRFYAYDGGTITFEHNKIKDFSLKTVNGTFFTGKPVNSIIDCY